MNGIMILASILATIIAIFAMEFTIELGICVYLKICEYMERK